MQLQSIFGIKIGMTHLFDSSGKLFPTTIVYCEPNKVLEVRTKSKHGADGIKVGLCSTKKIKNKSYDGVFKKVNSDSKKFIRSINGMSGYSVGDEIKVSAFLKGQCVDVQGISKGHGFTGAIKRWNYKIGPKSHGAGFPHRFQGSIAFGRGGSQGQRVVKGKKMAGHWGHDTTTIQNLFILDVLNEQNVLLVSGAIPGPSGQLVKISTSKKHPDDKLDVKVVYKKQIPEIINNPSIMSNDVAVKTE